MFSLMSPIEEFEPLWIGTKKADWRKDNKEYSESDVLHFLEYDFKRSKYTGRWIKATVTHIQRNYKLGIPKEYCVISFTIIQRYEMTEVQIKQLNRTIRKQEQNNTEPTTTKKTKPLNRFNRK